MIKKKNEEQIEKEGYLKQPNDLVAMRHPFDVVQGRVVSAIIEKLQDFISTQCEEGNVDEVLERFADKEFADFPDTGLVLTITYKELGVTTKNYELLRKSLDKMASIPVQIVRRGASGLPWKRLAQFCTPMIPSEFDEEGNLVESKYKRYFKVEISREVLKYIIDTQKGWSLYLRKVVTTINNKYAFRFYLLMSQWKNDGGHEFTVAYIREWLQMEGKVTRWNDFLARVIRPSERELRKMYDKGFSDLYFETELIYPEGKRRGEPDKLRFHVYGVKPKLASDLPLVEVTPESDLDHFLFAEFTLATKDREKIMSMVTLENHADFCSFCKGLSSACKKKKPKNLSGYCHTALVKFFKDWQSPSENQPAAPVVSIIEKHQRKHTLVRGEGNEKWEKVLAVCRERWDAALYDTWLKPLKFVGTEDGKYKFKLPTALFGRKMYEAGAYQNLLAVCRECYPDCVFEEER